MAAVLRLGFCIRRFSSATAGCTFRKGSLKHLLIRTEQHKPSNNLLVRCLATQNAQQNVRVDERSHWLDRALQRLDMNVRRIGRITRKELDDICNEIKNSGQATTTQSLLVIRCCGSLLADEQPEVRTALANDVWKLLATTGVKFDVSIYNALLKVYLENEHKFSPTEFLAEMEKKSVTPNRVTYQRLIAHYCQLGDIDGAGKILEFMKQEGLPINENVFNALITGHSRANDMESAKGIMEVMKNAKLEPSTDTYSALLCGYAEKGDIQSVRQVLEEAEKAEILLFDQDYFDIIYAFAKNGHTEHVDEIIGKLRKVSGYVQDAIITIIRLINCNQDEVAYKILQTLPQLTNADGTVAPSGHIMVRQLVRVGRPVEKILAFCEELKASGLNPLGLQKATEMALIYGKVDYAILFIKTMKEQNFPVRPHYFWPILVTLRKNKQEQRIFETVKLMMEMGCPANYNTFMEYVFPGISVLDTEVLVQTFKDQGYTAGAVVSPLVEHFISQNDTKMAAQLLDKYFIRVNANSVSRPLAAAYRNKPDLDSTLRVLKRMRENSERETEQAGRTDWVGQFVLDYVRVEQRNIHGLETLLQALLQKEIGISVGMVELIHNALKTNIMPNIKQLLEKLTSASMDIPGDSGEPFGIPHPREMNVNDLESHLIELQSKNMNTRGVLRLLLMAHCRQKNLERVEEIKRELDGQQFVYSGAMMAQLMDAYVHHNKFEEATHHFNEAKKQPDFVLDDHKIVNYAALLVKMDKMEEAIKLLTETEVHSGPVRNLEPNVWRLLNAAAEKGDVEGTQKLLDIVLKRKFTEPTNKVLGPVLKVLLMKDDLNATIAKFEEFCKLHRCTPWRNELFSRLILAEDSDRLQKVMDLNTEIHGEMNTLYDLAFSFLECGRFREARKILETPGLRAKHGRLDSMCERLVEDDKIDKLEQLVAITKDLFDVDRDRMYYYLIKGYGKAKDAGKALGVWTAMQEEDVQPSDHTLIYLAQVLEQNNQPIPFTVPKQGSATAVQSDFASAVAADNLDGAMNVGRQREEGGRPLSVSEASSLIEALVKKDRLADAYKVTEELLSRDLYPSKRVLRFLLLRIARGGDVNTIKALEAKIPDEVKRMIQFNNVLFNASINSGRHMEVIETLEKNPETSRTACPAGAFLSLLDRHPDLEQRVEKLAHEYVKHDYHGLLNIVWIHYFTHNQFEKADKIFKSTPRFSTNLAFRGILKKAAERNDESMGQRLYDVVKSTSLPPAALGRVCSTLMDVQIAKSELNEALQSWEKAKADGAADHIHRTTLVALKNGLASQGKAVPFVIPTSAQKDDTSSSSSSSSDSDSDSDEKSAKAPRAV